MNTTHIVETVEIVEFASHYRDVASLLEEMSDYLRNPDNAGTVWDVTVSEHCSTSDPEATYWMGRIFIRFHT